MSNSAVVLRNRPPARVENLLRALHNGHSRVFDLMRLQLVCEVVRRLFADQLHNFLKACHDLVIIFPLVRELTVCAAR